jgi:hypothetical protein
MGHEEVARQEQQAGPMVVVLEPEVVQVPTLEQEGPVVAEAANRWDSFPCSSGSDANRVAGES